MMDRFNFYDIYGFVLPGTLLTAIFWLPFGLATISLPSSEISSTLLLLVLAYITGHLLQIFAEVVVPSRVLDSSGELRERSSLILDVDNHTFSADFKTHLGEQIVTAFSMKIVPDDENSVGNRDVAFMQARTYLLENKSSGYVEQFEGLYSMMRGFACAFFVGCAYLVGWGLSFHWALKGLGLGMWWAMAVSVAGALVATGFTIHFEAQAPSKKKRMGHETIPASASELETKKKADQKRREKIETKKKASYMWVTRFLLVFAAGLGYFLGTWKPAPAQIEFFLWAALPLALIAGIRCLHAYSRYAENFAETVWRDFSASFKPDPPTPAGGAHTHEADGSGSHAHGAAAKHAAEPAHGGGHTGHPRGHS